VDVVAAALVRDGQVLAARRLTPPGWEFPGGKIEPGETPPQALVRECHEELGVEIACREQLAVAGDAAVTLQLWRAELLGAPPVTSSDHDELRWVDRTALAALDWLPLDRALLGAVERLLW
jgi:8-oxo-dGTP diphosphatase